MHHPTNATGMVLLAHGSSDPLWLKTFERLTAEALAASPAARLAYMELASPSLEDVVRELHQLGFNSIRVLPLFLAAGKHLRQDVPQMVAELSQATGCDIELLPPIGEHPTLQAAISTILQQSC